MKKKHIEVEEPEKKKEKEPKEVEQRVNIVMSHRKQAQPVKKFKDIKDEVELLGKLIDRINKHGHNGMDALAIAQPQINSENPLTYFMDNKKRVYINPVIIEQSEPTKSYEQCLSFPFRGRKKLKRYHKITVEFFDDKMKKHTYELEGLRASVFQHEIEHFNGKNIYDH